MDKIKIILVDDHVIVRDGIKALLIDSGRVDVVGEASNFFTLENILKKVIPDIVLLDISLQGKSGIEITEILRESYPEVKVIILSMYTDEDFIYNALRAGAKSYLPKNITQKELLEAVECVYHENEYFNEMISNVILKSYIKKVKNNQEDNKEKNALLTKREKEILTLFANGYSNNDIADKLYISVRTVESHKNHIMTKFKLKSVVDLIKFAIKNEIIKL